MASRKQKHSQSKKRQSFLDVVFSWSLSDILNKHLYKFQVEELPLTFSSTTQYMNSFIYPLLEETHADLLSQLAGISQAPASSYTNMHRIPTGNHKEFLYRMTLKGTTNYLPKVGDLIALTQLRPKCIDDLERPNFPFVMAFVINVDDGPPVMHVLLSQMIADKSLERNKRQVDSFVVYLTNLTTYMRIWQALNPAGNMNIIQKTLSFTPSIAANCDQCFTKGVNNVIDLKLRLTLNSFKLDTSQEAAVLSCLEDSRCLHHNSCTKLIWGPPGTGKTKTVASLLFLLLRMKRRTLTCAPTNIAVVGVVTRLLSLVRDNDLEGDTYGLGDILLFGNKERMKISDARDQVLLDVFLDHRVDSLLNCLSSWRNYVNYMIRFLENPMQEYLSSTVAKPNNTKTKTKKSTKNKKEQKPEETFEDRQCTFEVFAMNKFNFLAKNLIFCIKILYTHLPTSVVSLNLAKKMYNVTDLIKKVGEFVTEIVKRNGSLKEVFDQRVGSSIHSTKFPKLRVLKNECLQVLKELRAASCIPKSMKENKLKSFCLRNASLIFCTASSSIKLCKNRMTPIEFVLIDEAAQLKECESIIPLQLPGASKAVLVGDERQLRSMVQSKICEEAKFGRSLFERLVLLGHKKHLLNVQYRMHPSISLFPKSEFYDGQIMDGPNVISRARERPFLEGGMYGSFSFINVDSSKEEHDKNYSTRNMVEVAVIVEIIANLYKDSVTKTQTMTVGCISPYKAQVDAIVAKLGNKYNINQTNGGSAFTVNVRSVDGFQGGEEDVIIFSTVRCNPRGSVGFLSSRERANVALTRARHCMWIVGNKETMIKSGTVWNTLVSDAENRGCVYNARDRKNLAQIMLNAMVESADFQSLFTPDSILFKEAIWKVKFSNMFIKRILGITNVSVRKLVVSILVKLSDGWRQPKRSKRNVYNDAWGMSNMLEVYNVDGHYHLVWCVDVIYENSSCFQVLKFSDILTLSQIQQHAKRLECDFRNYTFDKINRCQAKHVERNLVLPMAWPMDSCRESTLALTSQLAKLCIDTRTQFRR